MRLSRRHGTACLQNGAPLHTFTRTYGAKYTDSRWITAGLLQRGKSPPTHPLARQPAAEKRPFVTGTATISPTATLRNWQSKQPPTTPDCSYGQGVAKNPQGSSAPSPWPLRGNFEHVPRSPESRNGGWLDSARRPTAAACSTPSSLGATAAGNVPGVVDSRWARPVYASFRGGHAKTSRARRSMNRIACGSTEASSGVPHAGPIPRDGRGP